MQIGMHAYAWCSEWSNQQLLAIDRAKELGLDFIEIRSWCWTSSTQGP